MLGFENFVRLNMLGIRLHRESEIPPIKSLNSFEIDLFHHLISRWLLMFVRDSV